ncbi:acyl-CoA dehydrogenase family protein [Trujillonella endophytica]|uniref:Acyl-CoA dehydrogenase n=1 Tax=Trujillonella endophytica TaxID=673521 RepID=A0A1H8V684_9ACTN|nr:acyl-CoA dehydrogenase family protein [Trujillella endophytica]SEP10774.1 Acyl-CoA dehydrogenase [Trujillella endophytica]
MTDLAELHEDLRAVARELLAAGRPDAGVDWEELVRAGWTGMEVPEELDGAGATLAEVAVVCEELGRAAARTPYLGSVVLAVGALARTAGCAGRDELLRDVASGETGIAVALDGALSGAAGPSFRLVEGAGGLRLHGRAGFVPDVADAARLLVPAAAPDGGVVLVALDAATPGLTVTAQPVLDATRALGGLTADGVPVGDGTVWRAAGDGEAALRALLDRAALAVACDSLGVAGAMLDRTVAYVGVREQFGRAIGSFQAVKHACADMLVQITVARQLVGLAVRAVVAEDADAGAAVARAKAYAGEAAVAVAGKAMQLHGGIGYTWESGVHLFLKRAALNRSLFGSPAEHRRALAARLG